MTSGYRCTRNRGLHIRIRIFEWIMTALFIVLLIFLLFWVWMIPVSISGESMEPTLLENQIVLLDRLSKYIKTPERGDVIAFKNPSTGTMLLKRIIALPSETVQVTDGYIYINGCPLSEDTYLNKNGYNGNIEEIVVPEGSVYTLSDNRQDIYDSRYSTIGCIPYDNIYGVLKFRIYPSNSLAYFD